MNNNILLWLWLKNALKDRSVLVYKTYLHFKSVEAAYNSTEEQLDELDFLTSEHKEALLNKDLTDAKNILNICNSSQIKIITIDDEQYPEEFRQIYNFPCVLFVLGDISILHKSPKITIVGTRSSTSYGTSVTHDITTALALSGFTVVTGVAKGIDNAVINSTVNAGKDLICILPCGHATAWYGTNYKYKNILSSGIIISEHLPDTHTHIFSYQERNRLLSALSIATVVTQAPIRSGAVMTANYAANQGKDVFSVMANVDMPQSAGSNLLIRDGAIPVIDYKDVLYRYAEEYSDVLTVDIVQPENLKPVDDGEELCMSQDFKRMMRENLDEDEKLIFSKIRETETDVDYIISSTTLPTSAVMSIISSLETKGAIVACPGNKYKIMI